MKKRILALFVVLVILFGAAGSAFADTPDQGLTILFTHDMHDYILPREDETGEEWGGFARLAALLEQERQQPTVEGQSYPVVTLDAGDFSMGTLFQTIYPTHAHELQLMGAMGFDVTTLGNHEFDYRADGLAKMLHAAVDSGNALPSIVVANYKPPQSDTVSKDAWQRYGISDYVILERDGLRIAVFGLMGKRADEYAPMSGMEWEPIADAAKRTVDYLKKNEDPDFVICLSHSGTSAGKGEDYELAEAVDGIDVIVSGHTHTVLNEPIVVNNTVIVSAGEYTEYLGRLTVSKKTGSEDTLNVVEYKLIPVDENVEEDPAIVGQIAKYKEMISKEYLAEFGYTFDQVLATSDFDFTEFSQLGKKQEEDSLGNLIADSYIHAVKQAEGENYIPVDFAVTALGVIRSSWSAGEITVEDVYDVSSLGVGADGTPGYPLVSVYLTGAELKDVFEVDASVAPLMSAAQLYGSGMTWTHNTNRMIFNKVTECAQILEDGTTVPLEDDRLYRVVSGLCSAQMLGTVNSKSYGILELTPKDAQGNVITDFEEHIIHDVDGSEVKEWEALASYVNHLGEIPEEYAAPQGRKVVYASWNPKDLLKNPNWITLAVLAVIVLLIVCVVLIVRTIVRGKGKRRYGRRHGSYGIKNYHGSRRRR